MFFIALCDDSQYDLDILTGYLAELKKEHFSIETTVLNNGKELVELHKHGHRFDLLILDMFMKPLNGIQTAQEVRKYDETVPILIVTATEKFAVDGYKVNARRYLIKPVNKAVFLEEVKQVLKRTSQMNEKYFAFAGDSGVTKVRIQEICYFESQVRTITLVTPQERYEFYGKISEIAEQMSAHHFFRAHKSFVINLENVRNVYKDVITMNDGNQVPLSKHKAKDFRQSFLEYTEAQF
jgi:DNA-binding LytR/AlgR family response regulator